MTLLTIHWLYLATSTYTPGTPPPHPRPQLKQCELIFNLTFNINNLAPDDANLNKNFFIGVGVGQGTHQWTAPISSACIRVTLNRQWLNNVSWIILILQLQHREMSGGVWICPPVSCSEAVSDKLRGSPEESEKFNQMYLLEIFLIADVPEFSSRHLKQRSLWNVSCPSQ